MPSSDLKRANDVYGQQKQKRRFKVSRTPPVGCCMDAVADTGGRIMCRLTLLGS